MSQNKHKLVIFITCNLRKIIVTMFGALAFVFGINYGTGFPLGVYISNYFSDNIVFIVFQYHGIYLRSKPNLFIRVRTCRNRGYTCCSWNR